MEAADATIVGMAGMICSPLADDAPSLSWDWRGIDLRLPAWNSGEPTL